MTNRYETKCASLCSRSNSHEGMNQKKPSKVALIIASAFGEVQGRQAHLKTFAPLPEPPKPRRPATLSAQSIAQAKAEAIARAMAEELSQARAEAVARATA